MGTGKAKDLVIVISLQETTAIDASTLQLIHVFKKALEAIDHPVFIIAPELPSLADLIIKSGWGNILYDNIGARQTK
jgi:anti-anti-sigma regulatory factor